MVHEEREDDIDFEERSEGFEAIAQAFDTHLRGIAVFQGDNDGLERSIKGFAQEVLSNPAITKEDLVDFINESSFMWSLHSGIVDSLPSD